MTKSRRSLMRPFKAKDCAGGATRGCDRVPELAKQHGVHPNQNFMPGRSKGSPTTSGQSVSQEARAAWAMAREEREREGGQAFTPRLGQLTVERDFLAKRPRAMSAPGSQRRWLERAGQDFVGAPAMRAVENLARSGVYRPQAPSRGRTDFGP